MQVTATTVTTVTTTSHSYGSNGFRPVRRQQHFMIATRKSRARETHRNVKLVVTVVTVAAARIGEGAPQWSALLGVSVPWGEAFLVW